MDSSKKAVALIYDFNSDDVPKVLVKGKGADALEMQKLALKYEIPLKEDKEIANLLYQFPELEEIPEQLYELVAQLYIELSIINQKL